MIEATPEGVRISRGDEYAGRLAAANTGEYMTPMQEQAVIATAESLTGELYNWPDLAAIALARLGWGWRWLLRLVKADRLLICTQLVVAAGKAAGMNWSCNKDPALITPGDLARRPGMEGVTIS